MITGKSLYILQNKEGERVRVTRREVQHELSACGLRERVAAHEAAAAAVRVLSGRVADLLPCLHALWPSVLASVDGPWAVLDAGLRLLVLACGRSRDFLLPRLPAVWARLAPRLGSGEQPKWETKALEALADLARGGVLRDVGYEVAVVAAGYRAKGDPFAPAAEALLAHLEPAQVWLAEGCPAPAAALPWAAEYCARRDGRGRVPPLQLFYLFSPFSFFFFPLLQLILNFRYNCHYFHVQISNEIPNFRFCFAFLWLMRTQQKQRLILDLVTATGEQ